MRKPKNSGKDEREHSSIAFPYVSFEDAFVVARAIFDAGGVAVDKDQLAGLMTDVGSFQQRFSAARMFGLIEVSSGKYQLTQLAYSVLDKNLARQKAAKAEAFLNVPLFKKLFDDFKGKILPPRAGLEQTFVTYGVPAKMSRFARLAFEKSASQTGYYVNGNTDRLIAPIIGLQPAFSENIEEESEIEPVSDTTNGRAKKTATIEKVGESNDPTFEPLIHGLLKRMPPIGTDWPLKDRIKWLKTLISNLDAVYTNGEFPDDQIELRIINNFEQSVR